MRAPAEQSAANLPPDATPAGDESQHVANVWPIMSGVLLALVVASLDQTVVSTAMPKVIASLQGFDRYAWVATAYMLTSTVTVPIYGKLSDIVGRKFIFLFGIAVFLLGSVLSGASQTMNELIIFRGLQGLGAGATMPIAFAIIGDLFPPRERGKIQGITGSVWGLSAIIGPTLGGWITDGPGWRWVFYINVPIGIVTLAVVAIFMPRLKPEHTSSRVDYIGALLLALTAVPLLLAFTWAGSTYAWGSVQIIGLLLGSIVAGALLVWYELHTEQPILDPRLFRNRIYADSVLVTFLIGAGMFGAISYIPLFVQGVIGASATGSGAVLTPLMVTAIVGSVVSGQLISRFGRYRYLAIAGQVCMIAGGLLLSRLSVTSTNTDVVIGMVVMGMGLGLGMSLYTIVVQNAFPRRYLGQVTSGLTFFRSIGGTIGIAVMGSFLTGHFSVGVRDNLPAADRAAIPPQVMGAFSNPQVLLSSQGQAALRGAFTHLPNGQRLLADFTQAIKLALSGALHDVFVVGVVIAAIAAVGTLFLQEIPLQGRAERAADAAEQAA
jgi:EmrB/QacA subfamily drug resistance transporter